MILTEEEAKTKWCPFVRTGLTVGMAVNRHVADSPGEVDGVYDETRCIGSACMAWRISEPAHAAYEALCFTKGDAPTPAGGWKFVEGDERGATYSRTIPAEPAKGYCGKAGRP